MAARYPHLPAFSSASSFLAASDAARPALLSALAAAYRAAPDETIPLLCAVLLAPRILRLVAPYSEVTLAEVTLILRAACATPGASLAFALASTLRNRYARAKARRAAYEAAAGREAAYLSGGAARPDQGDPFERRRLAAAWSQLTAEEQSLAALAFLDGLNGPELAAALGCEDAAARKRVSRLRARLRALLGEAPE